MKRFLNARETMVTEAIDGLLSSAPGRHLARLDGYPHVKVVVRKDWDRSKVAVVSGGGAGHEPAHAGFVGRGMLAGAISGEIFASPTVDAVLACILSVTGESGCLLIVKNYTGDRLNFGLAAERAKQLGRRVEMVVVSDDVAIPGAANPRGIAGTLFVHKIAGHLAETGNDLRTIKEAAQDAARAVHSLGVSLSACTVPGQKPARHLGEAQAELGLGIHGEPGAAVIEASSVKEIVDLMVDRLSESVRSEESRLGLLVNNLGGVPTMEMGVIVNEVVRSRLAPRIDLVFGPAPLMTSLDMNGFSLSLIELNDARREALLSAAEPEAWLPGARLEPRTILPLPGGVASRVFRGSANDETAALVQRICGVLIENEAELNALDARVGDGDTGSTFAAAARAVEERLLASALPLADSDQLCLAVGELLAQTMGGSSGVLLSIFFTAAGAEMKRTSSLRAAFGRAVAAVQEYGGARLGDRTMLDALVPAFDALEAGSLDAAAAAAQRGAEATASMTHARAGRSSYLTSANLAGVRDPGATAVALAFVAAAQLDSFDESRLPACVSDAEPLRKCGTTR